MAHPINGAAPVSANQSASTKPANPKLARFLNVISQIARGALLALLVLLAAATGFSFGGGFVVLCNGSLTISLIVGTILGAGAAVGAGYSFNRILRPAEAIW